MKKFFLFFITTLSLFPIFTTAVSAEESDLLREFAEVDTLIENLPSEVDPEEISSFLSDPNGYFSPQSVFQKLFSILTLGFQSSFTLFCGIFVILLSSCLFDHLKKNFGNGIESAFDLLFLLATALFSFSFMEENLRLAATSLESINTFMLATVPVTTVLMTLSGSVQLSLTSTAMLTYVITLVSAFVTKFLFPITKTLYCFSFLEGLGEFSLRGIVGSATKFAKRFCVFFFSLISAILALRSSLATASDSVAMRSVRFAAGNFIPIVGSLVGESSKTLAASFQLVRSECGFLCLVVLLSVILQPILQIAIQKAFLSMASCVGEVMGESRCSPFLKAISQTMDLILALLISHGCYLIFTLTLFIKAKGNL